MHHTIRHAVLCVVADDVDDEEDEDGDEVHDARLDDDANRAREAVVPTALMRGEDSETCGFALDAVDLPGDEN